MSAHVPAGPRGERPARDLALLALLAAVVVTGGGLLWALLSAPGAVRAPLAWGGGAAAVVVCAAVTAGTRFALTARRWRGQAVRSGAEADRLAREISWLAQDALPVITQRTADGGQPERVLAELPRPASPSVALLLDTTARELAAAERRVAGALAERAAIEDDVTRLASQTLPAVLERVRGGESADRAVAEAPHPASDVLQRLLETLAAAIGASERRGAAAMAACASAAARVQAQTTRMLAELRELQQQYGADKVFADLMELDHRVSQLGRLADSIALLSGGRSGRRWTKPIVMESILRGAMGRVDAYRRVRLHSTSMAAVSGYAAEGVMHALAELMDNAASFSAHGSEVHVYVEEEDAGVIIMIEDSGLGMRRRERSRAEGLVSQPLDLATLPGTRLGLAVVGRLASRYGLTVNFRPSSRGGTGVVVMVPRQLITQVRDESGVPAYALAGGPADGAAAQAEALPSRGAEPDPDSLPKRPRGLTLAAATRPAPGTSATAAAQPEQPEQAAARFAAFRQSGDRPRSQGTPPPPDGSSSE